MNEYLTISKFAEQAGVTPQAIYKRLQTDLATYLKVENGIKLLSEEALNLFAVKQQSKEAQRIQELEELVTQLKNEKNELNERLAANSEKIADIMLKHAQQVENFQLLLAQNQQLQQSLIQLPATVERVENQVLQLETTVTKRHWWQRKKKKE